MTRPPAEVTDPWNAAIEAAAGWHKQQADRLQKSREKFYGGKGDMHAQVLTTSYVNEMQHRKYEAALLGLRRAAQQEKSK